MTAAIVQLLNAWTLLALLTAASLWFGGAWWEHRRAWRMGWRAGRAALRSEQKREREQRAELRRLSHEIRATQSRITEKRRQLGVAQRERLLFDQEEAEA